MLDREWQPSASLENLSLRASVLAYIRTFFAERGVLEIETPLLCSAGNPEPNIEQFRLAEGFLQTSPEFSMKRLLAAGSGCIYQICKAFRKEALGRCHNTEFSLLEWYRVGFDYHQLMDEIVQLLQGLAPGVAAKKQSYTQVFDTCMGIHPLKVTDTELFSLVNNSIRLTDAASQSLSRDTALELLFTHEIEPSFDADTLTLIFDYPPSQAALAEIDESALPVAKRFELYWQGLELANGFQELRDAKAQRQRFLAQKQRRQAHNQMDIPLDERFLAALEAGLPECSGVALGLDRLLMAMSGSATLDEVVSFSAARA